MNCVTISTRSHSMNHSHSFGKDMQDMVCLSICSNPQISALMGDASENKKRKETTFFDHDPI